jgi:glycosyltransferase involved in cell wall biosynthesis
MLSVIVPCYNEALNIPFIYQAFLEAIKERKDIEVILVNNGSVDNSKEVLDILLEKDTRGLFKVIEVSLNQGYGHGILSGLKEAKGDVLAWTHADLQTDPSDVMVAYESYLHMNKPTIFVKGRRTNREFHAWFFSWSMQVLASWILKNSLEEINAQPKVFSRNFYENYLSEKAPFDFSLDLHACYWAKKTGQIIEIPVVVRKRKFGEAKGGGSIRTKIKLILRTLRYILKFRRQLTIENNS